MKKPNLLNILLMLIIVLLFGIIAIIITKSDDYEKTYYELYMIDGEIQVVDPNKGNTVYSEDLDTNSELVKALLKDNE